jgi:hypothetical protein
VPLNIWWLLVVEVVETYLVVVVALVVFVPHLALVSRLEQITQLPLAVAEQLE